MKWMLGCALVLSSAACESDDRARPSADGCDQADAPEWESFSAAFLEAYCTRCHASDVSGVARMNAPPAYDFDIRETVQRYALDIDEQLEQGTMPPDGEMPSAEDLARFRSWLACGAP